MKILIVDDDSSVRKVISEFLTISGHEVSAVEDGYNAISMLTAPNHDYEAVIMDLSMPEISGEEVLNIVQECPHNNHVKFIILSGNVPYNIKQKIPNIMKVFQKPLIRMDDLTDVLHDPIVKDDPEKSKIIKMNQCVAMQPYQTDSPITAI